MCMFMMKTKTKSKKCSPEQKEKAMKALCKMFTESEAGNSIRKLHSYIK